MVERSPYLTWATI